MRSKEHPTPVCRVCMVAMALAAAAFAAQASRAGDRGIGRAAAPPPADRQVCFFRQAGYAGSRWCVVTGVTIAQIPLPGWDDAISSMRIPGGVGVHVCTAPRLEGNCAILTGDRQELEDFDDAISSFVVLSGITGARAYL